MRFSAFVLGLLALSGALAQDNNNGGGGGNGNAGGGNDGGNNNNGGGGGGGGGGNNNNQQSASASASASRSDGGSSSNSGAPTPTKAVNTTQSGNSTSATLPPGAVVTTITSVLNGGSTTATFAFTLTVAPQPTGNATADGFGLTNGTLNGTDIYGNGTNGTANATQPWNDTLGYLPFTPKLDPAYGVAGALMILSGVPVATLGGKNRWSALAIISGYSVALFSLVMILSFGVSPALQPPSPDPPTAAMRGLYCLAVGISCLIGAGIGIFFYTTSKYWVGAAGGFCVGWFLMAVKKGGLVSSVGARWGIIGGLTAVTLLATLAPPLHEYVLLASSAWVGATAFMLGVDCFSRVGLKEFYIYNLGYSNLFPSLNDQKFPLTQSMQVELGALAAAALIAGAIQFKVVDILSKRRKQLRDEEAARIEAEEVARAAENFKNVDAELAEWEGHHGDGSSTTKLYSEKDPDELSYMRRPSLSAFPSTTPVLTSNSASSKPKQDYLSDSGGYQPVPTTTRRVSLMEEMGFATEGGTKEVDLGDPCPTPGGDKAPSSELGAGDELEEKLRLLAEVRKARQSIRSSMDQLRTSNNGTPGSIGSLGDRPRSSMGFGEQRSFTPAPSDTRSRHNSVASSILLDRVRHDSSLSSHDSRDRLNSIDRLRHSSFDAGRGLSTTESDPERWRLSYGGGSDGPPVTEIRPIAEPKEPKLPEPKQPSEWELRQAEFEQYKQERQIVSPPPPKPAPLPTVPAVTAVSDSVARAMNRRTNMDGTMSTVVTGAKEMTPGQQYGAELSRAISTQEAERRAAAAAALAAQRQAREQRARSARSMTTEELAERHREMLNRMQDQASAPIREQMALAEAREQYERQQRIDRELQRRKEAEAAQAAQAAAAPPAKLPRSQRGDTAREPTLGDTLVNKQPPRPSDRHSRMEEWRRSVRPDVPPPGQAPTKAVSRRQSASTQQPLDTRPDRPSADRRRSARSKDIA